MSVFFVLSGYISSPKRTRLGVRNYEGIVMLSSILRLVYVDPEWIAQEYLRRCKTGVWKEGDDKMLSNAGTWNDSWKQPHLDNQNQLN